jgi:hypothetical protein
MGDISRGLQKPRIPPASDAYLWWSAGAAEEGRIRDHGLSLTTIDIRDTMEALARRNPGMKPEQIVLIIAGIYCPDKLRRRYR